VLDIYGSTLVIHDYSIQLNLELQREIGAYLPARLQWLHTVVIKRRNGKTPAEKRGHIIRGEKPDSQITEHGVKYAINLTMNHDASFYLDTSNLRKWLMDNMNGKSVLNTFAYTGSLGIAALAGGASRVIQNDRSRNFLEIAKNSCALNDFAIPGRDFIAADFFPTIGRFKASKRFFDCAVIDPPFFSTTSKGKIDLVNESTRLINKVRPLINDGGILVAVNNALYISGKQYMEDLEKLCHSGYLSIREIVPVPASFTGCNIINQPVTDPSPFNHSTKIVVMAVKRKASS